MSWISARNRTWLHYGGALALVLLAALVRWLFAPILGTASPFLFFGLAILVIAFWTSTWPAIAATFVAMLFGLVFLGERAARADGLIAVATFTVNAGAIVALVTAMKRSRGRAWASDLHARERSAAASGAIEELNLLVDGAQGVALYILDPKGNVAIWNKGAERLMGWRGSDVVGRNAAMFYPADAIAEDKPERDLAAARSAGRIEEEGWRAHRDGTEFLAHVSITALYDTGGALRGFAEIVRDITDQRAAETAIKANEDHLRSILSTVPDAMVVIDDKGRILSFSRAAERLFGYAEAEIVGNKVNRLMSSPDEERHDDYLARYLRTGERRVIGIGRVVVARRKDGTTFPVELSVGEAEAQGQRIFTGFVRDLTERHEAEEKLQALQSELIHVSRVSAMGTMASTLAHELNQPITAVNNYMEAARDLLDKPEPGDLPVVRDALDEAAKQSMRAGEIIRRLRDFVARGEVARTAEKLPELIEEAAEFALIGAREKGVLPCFDLDPMAGAVLVDRVQIQQVLINLIRNAIDAMNHGERRELLIATAAGQPGFVRVTVADTGPGIAPAIADQLFTAFISTKNEGMGLGLSICRTIVEAHGGKIWVEPNEDGGSRFHFTVQRAKGGRHGG